MPIKVLWWMTALQNGIQILFLTTWAAYTGQKRLLITGLKAVTDFCRLIPAIPHTTKLLSGIHHTSAHLLYFLKLCCVSHRAIALRAALDRNHCL